MSTVATITETIPSLNLTSDKTEEVKDPEYAYTHLLPTYDHSERYPRLVPFRHEDPGHRALALAKPTEFLDNATRIHELTPAIGTEIEGVNLAKLSSTERDQLALFVAKRGLVVFRGQKDFLDSSPDRYLEWGRHFGRLHIHPTSGHPAGVSEIHLVYREGNKSPDFYPKNRITSTIWHSDVSYELQPPGLTTFFLLSQPESGGDTLFVSTVNVLKHLSPQFVGFLRTLKAVHSGVRQADDSRNRGGVVRRDPVEHVHPIIRRHPVTGEEALYVNKGFTRRIIGLKDEESDVILNFLYNHIAANADSQARLRWAPYTVAIWDNRVTCHSAILDFETTQERRHGARITPQAERPVPANPDLVLDN